MKFNTTELTGAALDWAVAKTLEPGKFWTSAEHLKTFHPSTDWAIAGPIIEREDFNVTRVTRAETTERGTDILRMDGWSACTTESAYWRTPKRGFGPTPLVAAMRLLVATKLGDTVIVPDDVVATETELVPSGHAE